MRSLRLDAAERRQLEERGYLLREGVFRPDELERLRAACERLIQRLQEEGRRAKLAAGSYVFELQRRLGTVVKWEKDDPEVVLGVEPFAHLCDELRDSALDPRLVEPIKDLIGAESVALFTEKLNVKRAQRGGPIVLHQDYPYWVDVSDDVERIATAMVFLDDATRANGCLEVAPGSHREGPQARRALDGFGSFEMDAARFDLSRLVPLETRAGSVALFGPYLVHRSAPNASGDDRRALLFSYQPAGLRHLREQLGLGL